MTACIQIGRKRSIRLSHHEHRLSSDMGAEEITRIRHVPVVAEEHPALLEDVPILGFQDLGIVVDGTIDPEHAILGPVIDIGRIIFPVRQRIPHMSGALN